MRVLVVAVSVHKPALHSEQHPKLEMDIDMVPATAPDAAVSLSRGFEPEPARARTANPHRRPSVATVAPL